MAKKTARQFKDRTRGLRSFGPASGRFSGTGLGAQVTPQYGPILRTGVGEESRSFGLFQDHNVRKNVDKAALSGLLGHTVGAMRSTGGVRGTLDALLGVIPVPLIERRRKSPTWCKTEDMNATCRLSPQSTACQQRTGDHSDE